MRAVRSRRRMADVVAHIVVARVARYSSAVGAFVAVADWVVAVLVRGEFEGWAGHGVVNDGEAEAAADGDLVVAARNEVVDFQREDVFGASKGFEGCASVDVLGFILGKGLGRGKSRRPEI